MMNFEQIVNEIAALAQSQGFYGRTLARIREIEATDQEMYESLKRELEAEEFETTLDLIEYLEEGKHHKKPEQKKKIWKVPVVWEMYGLVEIEAETPEEAIEKWHEKENSAEPFDLPAGADYVDGSFVLADEDEDNLAGLIKIYSKQ